MRQEDSRAVGSEGLARGPGHKNKPTHSLTNSPLFANTGRMENVWHKSQQYQANFDTTVAAAH